MAGSSSSGLFDVGSGNNHHHHHQIPISSTNIGGGPGQHHSSAGLGPAADVLSAVGCNTVSSSGGSMVGPTTSAAAVVGAGSSATADAPQNQRKRRNVPGIANPDAEVIALSPKSLMATNRFICEVCNKGFQREQNLQLHRRGHNLPWKLKQKNSNKDGAPVRKKVYLCPEPSCVHHDPSRALGDLTGIKKHFYRKHGEKKFKCDKCSKKYAVQSDWKAHRKTCGTREYRCDCGTVFSRRDSFVTHRAFCDVITREALNHPTTLTAIGGSGVTGSLFAPSTAAISATGAIGLGLSQHLHHHHHNNNLLPSSSPLQMQSLDHQNPNNNDHLLLDGNSRSKFDHLLQSPMGSFHALHHPTTNMYNPNQNGYGGTLDDQMHHQQQLGLQMHPSSMQTVTEEDTDSAAGGNCTTTTLFSNIGNFFSPNNCSSSHFHHNLIGTNGNNNQSGSNLFSQSNNILGGSGNHQISSSAGFTSLFGTSGNIHQQQQTNITTTAHMSATALLQKAAQIGSTSSNNHQNSFLIKSSSSAPDAAAAAAAAGSTTTNKLPPHNSILPSTYGTTLFDETDPSTTNNIQEFINTLNGGSHSSSATSSIRFGMGMSGSDRLTRDFLGVGEQQHQGIDFIMSRGTAAGLHNTPTTTDTNNVNNAVGHHNFGAAAGDHH